MPKRIERFVEPAKPHVWTAVTEEQIRAMSLDELRAMAAESKAKTDALLAQGRASGLFA